MHTTKDATPTARHDIKLVDRPNGAEIAIQRAGLAAKFVDSLPPMVEALAAWFARPEVQAGLRDWQQRLMEIEAGVEAVEAPGYIPYFEELGSTTFIARLQAAFVRHIGRRYYEQYMDERVALKAFHRLARRQRWHPTSVRQVVALHDNGWDFDFLDRAFRDAGCPELKATFVACLRAVKYRPDADPSGLMAIVARIAPYAPSGRGRPISAETMLHRTFLSCSEAFGGRDGYTYGTSPDRDDVNEDFIDAATRATRIEIGDPTFNPIAARRALKKMQMQEDEPGEDQATTKVDLS